MAFFAEKESLWEYTFCIKNNSSPMQKISYVLLLLSVYLLMSCTFTQPRKEAFIAGCFDSGLLFYQFEMYPDSTYCLDIIGPE